MKLQSQVIDKLKGDRTLRLLLCDALDFKEQWIDKLIDANKANGPLTTASALKVLREQMKIEDSEILEPSEVKEPQN